MDDKQSGKTVSVVSKINRMSCAEKPENCAVNEEIDSDILGAQQSEPGSLPRKNAEDSPSS